MTAAGDTGVVIVGGGITGVSAARTLAERGTTDVVVLEKAHVGAGSTGRSAGVIETQYLTPFEVETRAAGRRAYEALAEGTRFEFHRVGYLRLLLDPADEPAFRRSVSLQRRHGIDDARFLDPETVSELVPDLTVDDVHGGIFGPSDGYADPYTAATVIAEECRDLGVEVRTGVTATDVVTEGGRVVAVETDAGRLACDAVVNAAGPWAPRFAERVGLDLPAAPYRRQLLVAAPRSGTSIGYTVPMVIEYLPAGSTPGLYFRDDGTDRLVLGLHRETGTDEAPADPDAFDGGYDEAYVLSVLEKLEVRAPAFADLEVVDGWSGLYTITPDSNPIVDRHPDLDGYVVAAGFSGKGFQIGPVVGGMVADLVLDGEIRSISDPGPVRLDRFE